MLCYHTATDLLTVVLVNHVLTRLLKAMGVFFYITYSFKHINVFVYVVTQSIEEKIVGRHENEPIVTNIP